MKYLMLVMTEPIAEVVEGGLDIEQWVTAYDATGEREFGDRLAPADDAVTVRIRVSGTEVTAGAANPAHVHIAGIDILECESLERATEIALAHPMAKEGLIEVRPFYDWAAGN